MAASECACRHKETVVYFFAMVKLNNADNYEPLMVRLSKEKTPIAFENKVQELIEEGGMTRSQAERFVEETTFELELYYEKGYGLFAVESEAVECVGPTIFSPYSRELCEDSEETATAEGCTKEYIVAESFPN